MPCNVGTADRAIRLVVGLVLLPLLTGFAAASPWLWWAALAVGVVLLATAGMRFCPLYTLLGVRTCRP
jgi:ABC-type phosphate transport system auxiliary subunit